MNNWIAIKVQNGTAIPCLDLLFSGYNKMQLGMVVSYYKRDSRFVNDQLFTCNDVEMAILDGVILNLSELMDKYHVTSIEELVDIAQRKDSLPFWNDFIGPFCGFRYQAQNDSFVTFGNQTGDAPVFYYQDTHYYAFSNDVNMLVKMLKEIGIPYSLDEKAALYIMTYGYMIDDRTMIKEIKRLSPGSYVNCEEQGLVKHEYYRLVYGDNSISEEQAIEEVDKRFRVAVKRCFDKDLEYGYKRHLADMSGGLDSRMVSWVARDLGYSNIVNISYSQSQSDEQKIASLVSRHLNNVFIHEQLDDASFLLDIEDLVYKEAGLAVYYGITGGKTLLSSINMNEFGLEHTGQLGDVVLGTFTSEELPIDTPYKRYSYLLHMTVTPDITEKYENLEDFLINTRGFLGVVSTHLIRRYYTYAVSPFLDIEFLSYCMSLPMKYRRDSYLYWKWIEAKYPEAARMISTRERKKSKVRDYLHRARGKIARETKALLFSMGLGESKVQSNHMNPIQYWYDTNPLIRNFINEYYERYSYVLDNYPDTKKSVSKMMISNSVTDKLLALTVTASVKLYFGESDNGEAIA